MKVTQISLFLENRKGRLAEVCSLLGETGVNIRALTIAETDEFGVLRMVVDNPDKALQTLRANNFVASVTDIVAIEVGDRPGGLAAVLKTLNENDLNIEYMYGFVEKKSDNALMVFRFDEPDRAIEVLQGAGLSVVGKSDIESL
ncbi:MAG: ACT domain-containing protein [Chitinivibrionales bacterium]|nr:ACT domain-containing protein [Chitinivibrionales bacterium]